MLKNTAFTVFATALLCSTGAFAKCVKTKTVCSHYQGSELFKQSKCIVTECSDVYGASKKWKWSGYNVNIQIKGKNEVFINGKPGYFLERNGLFCYAESNDWPNLFCKEK